MKPYGVIYLLIDGTNDMEYIGQTIRSVEVRFREHEYGDTYVDRAIRAHSAENFVTVVLKVCYSREELDYWERHFIKYRNTKAPNGYNCTDGGDGGIPGFSHTAESRAKMSAARMGEKNGFFNKHHTPETRARLSAIHTGKKCLPKHVRKCRHCVPAENFQLKRARKLRRHIPEKNSRSTGA